MLNVNSTSSSSGGSGSIIIASTVSSSNGIPKLPCANTRSCRSMPARLMRPLPLAISVTVRPTAPVCIAVQFLDAPALSCPIPGKLSKNRSSREHADDQARAAPPGRSMPSGMGNSSGSTGAEPPLRR